MIAPGGLRELGDEGLAAWADLVARCWARVEDERGPNPRVLAAPDARTSLITVVDWTGLPVRHVAALTRAKALEGLDDPGRALQEEYLEWRVVRDGAGRIRRVELTTELSEYWCVLAGYEPARVLEQIAEFAGHDVPPEAVFGACDPASATPAERAEAFAAAMLRRPGPLDDGRAAICCMVQQTNSLAALIGLTLGAAEVRMTHDAVTGRPRCATADEVIPLLGTAAQADRGSDSVLVERLGRLAYERRLIAFDDPLGVYIQSVEHTRLLTPDGDPVPTEWVRFGRGSPAFGDEPARWQRVVVECPEGSGVTVSDLVDAATEQRINFGGQIAELVQVAFVLRASASETAVGGAE